MCTFCTFVFFVYLDISVQSFWRSISLCSRALALLLASIAVMIHPVAKVYNICNYVVMSAASCQRVEKGQNVTKEKWKSLGTIKEKISHVLIYNLDKPFSSFKLYKKRAGNYFQQRLAHFSHDLWDKIVIMTFFKLPHVFHISLISRVFS